MQHNRLSASSEASPLNIEDPNRSAPQESKHGWTRGAVAGISLLALWTLTHRYEGLNSDGEIYALQALSRLHPYFTQDILLAYGSQDAFTLFSPVFALVIKQFGLIAASTLIFSLFTASHFAAVYALVRRFFDGRSAYLAVAVLICVPATYGSFHVFRSGEDYLTARSAAEALAVWAIAAYCWRYRVLAALLCAIALLMHPIMALPGVLLLVCLALPVGWCLAGAILGLIGAFALSEASAYGLLPIQALKAMDPAWLEVVKERSNFLFLQLWRLSDAETQLRPLLSLVVTLFALENVTLRKLCFSAALVGATGLALAGIAGEIGPVPILLQGQAWRWMWITVTVTLATLAPTALSLWRNDGWGRFSAVLLVSGWVFDPINGELAIAGAAVLCVLRRRTAGLTIHLNLAAYATLAIIGAWAASNVWEVISTRILHSQSGFEPISFVRSLLASAPLALALAALLWSVIVTPRHRLGYAAGLALVALSFLPTSLLHVPGFESVREHDQYRDWSDSIPESTSVLVLPSAKSAVFPWYTLERISYTTVSQSAGVVFSSKTAAEIRRRSEVLLPVMPPNWRILSQIRLAAVGKASDTLTPPPLTAQSLAAICRDEKLGFVIAQEDVGFSPIRHTGKGVHKNWNLYDCRRVRARAADNL